MGAHVFVDETKERGFVVAVALISSSDVTSARQAMRRLILPGQRRIHFHKEKNDRRQRILETVTALSAEIMIFDAGTHRDTKTARDTCLIALVSHLAKISASRLVLERDDSTLKADQRLLYHQVRAAGIDDTFRYDHMRAHEESLLAVPDAAAWCWAKGGRWRSAVQRSVIDVREV